MATVPPSDSKMAPSSDSENSRSSVFRRALQKNIRSLQIQANRQQARPFDFSKSLRSSSSNESSPSLRGKVTLTGGRKGQSNSVSPLLSARKSLVLSQENTAQENRQLPIPNPREIRKFLKEILKGELDFAEAYLRMYNFDSATSLIAYCLLAENFDGLERMRKLLGTKITPDMHYFIASSFLGKKDFDPQSQIFQQTLDLLEGRELALLLFEAVFLKNETLVEFIVKRFTLTEMPECILEAILYKAVTEGLTNLISLLLLHPFSLSAIGKCQKAAAKPEVSTLLSQHQQINQALRVESKKAAVPPNLKSNSENSSRNASRNVSHSNSLAKKAARKPSHLKLPSPKEREEFLQKVITPSRSEEVGIWLQTFEAGPVYLRLAFYLAAKTGCQATRLQIERAAQRKITLDMWYLVGSIALSADNSSDASLFNVAVEKLAVSQDPFFLFLLLHQAISKRRTKEIDKLITKTPTLEKSNNEELLHFFFEEIVKNNDVELMQCLIRHNLPLKEFYGQLLLQARPPMIQVLGPHVSRDVVDDLLKRTEDPEVINAALPFASPVAQQAIATRQKSTISPSSAKALSPKGTQTVQTVEETEENSVHEETGSEERKDQK